MFTLILNKLDHLVKELQLDEEGDVELQKGIMEARRAENLIKYKDEIHNRPRSLWL